MKAIVPQYSIPTLVRPQADSPYIALTHGSSTMATSQVVLTQKTNGS